MEEAQYLYCANDVIKAKAESGELAKIHQQCAEAEKYVDDGVSKVMDQIDRTMQQITEREEEIYSSLREKGLMRLRSHNDHSLLDSLSMALAFISLENQAIVQGSEHQAEAFSLKELIGARAHALTAKVHILEELLDKVDHASDSAARHELRKLTSAKDSFVASYGADISQISGDAKVLKESIDQTRNGDMAVLLDHMNQHDQAFSQRNALYADYLSPETRMEMDNFRQDLLKHLAGSIVVKDHRVRYQKEQFDRYLTSNHYGALRSQSQSLKTFATNYALLIETLTEKSHNGKCPKIEANYDDFSEKTIRPLNATIFYYFFSASSSANRTWAQWMLSAARFPNDRMRRAYMRVFA